MVFLQKGALARPCAQASPGLGPPFGHQVFPWAESWRINIEHTSQTDVDLSALGRTTTPLSAGRRKLHAPPRAAALSLLIIAGQSLTQVPLPLFGMLNVATPSTPRHHHLDHYLDFKFQSGSWITQPTFRPPPARHLRDLLCLYGLAVNAAGPTTLRRRSSVSTLSAATNIASRRNAVPFRAPFSELDDETSAVEATIDVGG